MACVGNDDDLREWYRKKTVLVHRRAQGRCRGRSHHCLGRPPPLNLHCAPAALTDHATSVCVVSTHSKVAEQQVIRTFVTAPIHFGCDCVDAFPVQIEGPEHTRLIEAHVGLNALQCVFVHEKRSLNRAIVSPKSNRVPGRIIEAALIWKTKHDRSRSGSKPPGCPHRHAQPSWGFLAGGGLCRRWLKLCRSPRRRRNRGF